MKDILYGTGLVLGALASTVHSFKIAPTVETTSGPVNGHAASSEPSVSAFFGIPYALPPTGSRRFQPPEPYTGTSLINGSSIGFACPAITSFLERGNDIYNYNVSFANLTAQGIATISSVEQVGATFSEDCLTLNVWAPSGGEAKKAVMIWIYGGGYTTGSTQIALYDGQHLAANQDVIVVSINYRVDIFGFPGNPELTNHNPGFLDQRLGVEWVRDNIAAFGGDPSRMILFGQSAGAASVDSYTYSWHKDPIVSGFIMESGTAGLGTSIPIDNAAAWYNATESLGCGTNVTAESSEILSCMQGKDVYDILHAQGSNSFEPTADGITGFSDYPALGQAGKFAQLPVLAGNNDFESGVFIALDALDNVTHDATYWESYTNTTFACPAGARANVSYLHDLPIWRYRWFGNFPNTRLYTDPDSGAYHGSEMPFIYDTLPRGEGIPPDTNPEVAIRAYIQGAWAAFAKDPVHGLSNYEDGWQKYSPFEERLIRIAWNNQTGANAALPVVYDSTCLTTFPVSERR